MHIRASRKFVLRINPSFAFLACVYALFTASYAIGLSDLLQSPTFRQEIKQEREP
jgi:hypothetical protein